VTARRLPGRARPAAVPQCEQKSRVPPWAGPVRRWTRLLKLARLPPDFLPHPAQVVPPSGGAAFLEYWFHGAQGDWRALCCRAVAEWVCRCAAWDALALVLGLIAQAARTGGGVGARRLRTHGDGGGLAALMPPGNRPQSKRPSSLRSGVQAPPAASRGAPSSSLSGRLRHDGHSSLVSLSTWHQEGVGCSKVQGQTAWRDRAARGHTAISRRRRWIGEGPGSACLLQRRAAPGQRASGRHPGSVHQLWPEPTSHSAPAGALAHRGPPSRAASWAAAPKKDKKHAGQPGQQTPG